MRFSPSAQDLEFMQMAIDLAAHYMRAGEGGPFGAVIVRDGKIMGRGWNQVTSINDPTAHAEINAIRLAAAALKTFQLRGCVLYSSCEPCPMCLGAAYWARLDRIVFGATRADAARAGFDDEEIYHELSRPPVERKLPMQEVMRDRAMEVISEWLRMPGRTPY
jgi:tRNA(Arg) A34 adenosine deaminase TadA